MHVHVSAQARTVYLDACPDAAQEYRFVCNLLIWVADMVLATLTPSETIHHLAACPVQRLR